MWRIALVLALLAASARADVIDLRSWATDSEHPEVHDGALVLTHVGSFSRMVALDPNGWTVEITFALDHRKSPATLHVDIYDTRQHVTLIRAASGVSLGQSKRALANDDQPHVYRLEAAAGRHRLLVDGIVVLDSDVAIDALGDNNAAVVSFSVHDQPAANRQPTRIMALEIDTAPKKLLPSKYELPAVAAFADWLRALREVAPDRRATWEKLDLSELAHSCVAFAIVASAAKPHPAHYRQTDVDKWLTRATPAPKTASPPGPAAPRKPAPPPDTDPFGNPAQSRGPYCDPVGPCDCGRPCGGDATPFPVRAMRLVQESFGNPHQLDDAAELILYGAKNLGIGSAPPKGAHPPPVWIDGAWLATTLANLAKDPHACE